MPRFKLLQDWLTWQETLHPTEIELGLHRVLSVFKKLHPGNFTCPVVTVAGTNGKGSSMHMLETIYRADGYKTASYTSPHLLRYNERICINGNPVDDQLIINAFQRIDDARAEISLTYFEFGTLAALDIFMRQQPDIVLLEVGLGGRLDAVNIIDSDVALITSIDIDHTQWLGNDRDSIGREKAGIMRNSKPAVCSDTDIPRSILQYATEMGTPFYRLNYEFSYILTKDRWSWNYSDIALNQLPVPALHGAHQYQNAAGVLMVVLLLMEQRPVSFEAICEGLQNSNLAGRFQTLPGRSNWICDVAHNPDSVAKLSQILANEPVQGRTIALLGMLSDKDIPAALRVIMEHIDIWHISPLPTKRSATASEVSKILKGLNVTEECISLQLSIEQAYRAIDALATEDDRVVIFGSFYTVAETMKVALSVAEQALQ
ncbi:MAG: bifunctional tetrahydrofolate synthase/dihydrofolate synthase [Gammaproteobacteria bacterium]|nr:bifunctional tetrahydrofolate synthase/dihydrofolate synthase [Gammaproteobacteria bacterium]